MFGANRRFYETALLAQKDGDRPHAASGPNANIRQEGVA